MSPTASCWVPLSASFVPFLLLLPLKIKQAEQVASGERPPGYFDPEQEYPEGEEDEFEEVTVSSDHPQRRFVLSEQASYYLEHVTIAFCICIWASHRHGLLSIVAPTAQAKAVVLDIVSATVLLSVVHVPCMCFVAALVIKSPRQHLRNRENTKNWL